VQMPWVTWSKRCCLNIFSAIAYFSFLTFIKVKKRGNLAHHFKPQEPWTCWDTNRITLTSDRRGKEEGRLRCPYLAEAKVATCRCILPFIPTRQFWTSSTTKWKLFHQLSAFTVSYVLHSRLVWCMSSKLKAALPLPCKNQIFWA